MYVIKPLADKECSSCGSKDVPLWRKDASGHYICNWCGLHWKNNCNSIPTRHSSKQKQLIVRFLRKANVKFINPVISTITVNELLDKEVNKHSIFFLDLR